jgi:hypothetical protein
MRVNCAGVGERFPYPDPDKQPVLSPVPAERSVFLHAILQVRETDFRMHTGFIT